MQQSALFWGKSVVEGGHKSDESRLPGTEAPAGLIEHTATLARSGEYWTVACDGVSFLLQDLKGLGYLHLLLQHPGSQFFALDLLALSGPSGGEETAGNEVVAQLRERPDVSVHGLGDAGPMLDDQAKLEYRRRLSELNAELEELRAGGAADRATAVESEIDFLTREILRATGLGGRSRRSGSVAERARISVTRAIRSTIQKNYEYNR